MNTNQDKLIELLGHLTARLRTDVVSLYSPPAAGEKRGRYVPRRAPLAAEDLLAHLTGGPSLGLYLLDGDEGPGGRCRAAVVDLDDKEKKLSWAQLCGEALRVSQELERRGATPWPVRSGSGHGVHLWLLWRDPQDCAAVRHLLRESVAAAETAVHVDLFPAQDRLVGDKLGNLIALPFSRASRPITHLAAGEVWEDLDTWRPTSPALSAPVAVGAAPRAKTKKHEATYGAVDVAHLAAALAVIPADAYETWLRVGSALKRGALDGQLEEGKARGVWDAWARSSPKYDDLAQEKNWRSLTPDGSLTLGTVWHLAKEHGWREDKSPVKRDRDTDDIAELNRGHFLCEEGGRVFIFREDWDDLRRRHKLTRLNAGDFKLKHLNQRVLVGSTKKGVPVTEDLGTAWLSSEQRRQYDEIVLRPEGAPPNHYNLWKGWSTEPSPDGSCELFLQHLRDNLCRGDEASYRYLLNWSALTVQRPQDPIGVAVVLRGGKGTGKGTFARALGSLFGQHYVHIFSSRDLTGRFNSHLRDCILLFADEAVWAGSKQEASVLSGIITEPELPIEGKGRDLITVRNMLHLIIATNNEWSVPAGLDERRFFALHVTDDRQQDTQYFKKIITELREGGAARWLHELLTRDVSGFNVFDVPQTEELARQKLLSLEPWAEWWYAKLRDGAVAPGLAWDQPTPIKAAYLDYVHHCRLAGHREPRGPEYLGRCLRGLLPGEPAVTRGRLRHEVNIAGEVLRAGELHTLWRLSSLQGCREHFAKKARAELTWGELTEELSAPRGDDAPLLV